MVMRCVCAFKLTIRSRIGGHGSAVGCAAAAVLLRHQGARAQLFLVNPLR